VSPYGVHKKIGEELCLSYARHFGESVVVVRLFSVYGAGLRKQLLWDASLKLSDSGNTFFGSGTETRDWLHVRDAASLLLAASSHAAPEAPVLNGGTGRGVAVGDLIGELFSCFGRTDTPRFSGVTRSGDPLHYVADMSRLREWDWRPRVPWREGVREYAAWFRAGAP